MFEVFHPSQSYQNLNHAQRLLAKAYKKAGSSQFGSALAYFREVSKLNSDECTKAFADVGIAACEAALLIPLPQERGERYQGKAEYEKVSQELAHTIPPDCLV